MRVMARVSVAIGLLLAGPRVFAFDRAACFDAATEGQSLRDARRLVEARERFRVCAQDECPVSMKGDCAAWLADVEKSLPTVVVSTRSETGTEVTDIVVLVDGRPFISMVDGKSMAIDPGPHTFRFVRTGGACARSSRSRERKTYASRSCCPHPSRRRRRCIAEWRALTRA
jgi:hypothetical protein